MDYIFKGFCQLVGPPNAFLWWNWTNILGNQKFPSIASDTCWTYANEFNTDLSDWMLSVPLLLLGSGSSFCTVLAMCAHLFRCPYTLCVQIYNISMWYNSMKIMLICGLHWHSRYSIMDFYIVLLHFHVFCRDLLWPTNISRNSLYTSRSSQYSVILCDLVILIISHVSHVPNDSGLSFYYSSFSGG